MNKTRGHEDVLISDTMRRGIETRHAITTGRILDEQSRLLRTAGTFTERRVITARTIAKLRAALYSTADEFSVIACTKN